MAVTAAFCPLSLQPLRDQNDVRIVGGFTYVYAAGTTTLVTTYADAGLVTPNPNPLRSDGFGRIPPIWAGAGNYKIVAQDAGGAQLFVVDNLPGGVDYVAQAEEAAQEAGTALAVAQTGDVKFKHGTSLDAGWLIANGRTIGNGQTQATARANDDTKALFLYLWNNDASLAVNGGRGVTATSDFAAAKTITLPDYRGRVITCCDQMGADATAGVITAASTATPNLVGSTFGAETVTLTQAQLPAVTPTITIDGGNVGGLHAHAATTDQQGTHSHGGATQGAGNHTHPYVETNVSSISVQGGAGAANNGAFSGTTGGVGDHAHGIYPDGIHNHNVTIDGGQPGGGHKHTATASAIGTGGAHPNMQPGVLLYAHIKL